MTAPDAITGQPRRKRVACIGECMVELTHRGPADLVLAFGGDTANTAVYLRRLTQGLGIDVDYVTALGDDPYSDAMIARWQDEGVGTVLVQRIQRRLPGLYTIRTDERGERSFTYWRGEAAARDLLLDGRGEALASALCGIDLVYLSGITLSILDRDQRTTLLAILDAVRQAGGNVAFDGNFRPAGWPDLDEARHWFRQALGRADIALPTFEDEQALFGDPDAEATAKRLHGQGVGEVAVKLGAAGCFLSTEAGIGMIETTPVEPVVDSTAAGDSFNAGYLACRLLERPPAEAVACGQRLAADVIRHPGAIMPKAAMPSVMSDDRPAPGRRRG